MTRLGAHFFSGATSEENSLGYFVKRSETSKNDGSVNMKKNVNLYDSSLNLCKTKYWF